MQQIQDKKVCWIVLFLKSYYMVHEWLEPTTYHSNDQLFNYYTNEVVWLMRELYGSYVC